MNRIVKVILMLVCVVVLTIFSGCSNVEDGFNAMANNTTVEEATADLAEINSAIVNANRMLASKDNSVYGELVLEGAVSFKDVVEKNDLKDAVATKRIDGVSYHLYWDKTTNYPFWSTDGSDDIRNSQAAFANVVHKDSFEIKNKTNISELK